MEVKAISENEDGSADCIFEMTQEEMEAFARIGIVAALEKAVDAYASDISPERVDFPDELRHVAEQAGFLLWADKEWKPEGAVVDWAYEYNDATLVKFYRLVKSKWVGLMDAQVEEIAEYHGISGLNETSRIDFYLAIEAKLKEMNCG